MNQDEFRDLLERHAQIQEMTHHPGWGLLLDYMRAQMEAKQRWLLIGNARSMEDYKNVAGWLQGVGDMCNAPDALADQVERERRQLEPAGAGG